MLRKAIIFTDKTIDRIIVLVSLLFFLVCGYAMYDAAMVYYNANDTSILKYKPQLGEDPAIMREISENVVAWLTIDDTNIDYPVLQGEDNFEYLNKNPYGDYSLSGSIFLDSACDGNFENDDYYLIYGHHMEYGSMFGALDEFQNKEFFKAHQTGTLTTPNGKRFSIKLFAYVKALATENTIFDPANSSVPNLYTYIAKHATYFHEDELDRSLPVLALSTCQSAENIERLIVFGTLAEIQ